MRLGDLADPIFSGAREGSQMVSNMVSEINLSEERAEMGRGSLSASVTVRCLMR